MVHGKASHSSGGSPPASRYQAPVSRPVNFGISVDRVALGQVCAQGLPCSPVGIMPLLLHIHSRVIWGLDKGAR
jgi:hypothetical protein